MPTSSILNAIHSNHNKNSNAHEKSDVDTSNDMASLSFQFQNSINLNSKAGTNASSPVVPSTNSAGQTIEDMMILRGLKAPSQNVTESVPVPSSEHVAEIVGRQGCKIKALRAKTNTYIKTPIRGEAPKFVITGRKEDVQTAKHEIQLAADHFSQIRARRGSSSSSGSGGNGNGSSTSTANFTAASSLSPKLSQDTNVNTDEVFTTSPTTSTSPSLLINVVPPILSPSHNLASNASPTLTPTGQSCKEESSNSSSSSLSSCSVGLTRNQANAVATPSNLLPGEVVRQITVPYQVVGLVVGPKGMTIKRIQQNTNTYIVTPSRDCLPVFEIKGMLENVEQARAEIENYIASRTATQAMPMQQHQQQTQSQQLLNKTNSVSSSSSTSSSHSDNGGILLSHSNGVMSGFSQLNNGLSGLLNQDDFYHNGVIGLDEFKLGENGGGSSIMSNLLAGNNVNSSVTGLISPSSSSMFLQTVASVVDETHNLNTQPSSIWSSSSNGLITSNMFNSLQQTLNENENGATRSSSLSSSSSTSSSSSSLEHQSHIQQNFLTSATTNLLATSNNVEITPSSFLFLNDSPTSSNNSTGYYDFGISSNTIDNGSINFQSSVSNDHHQFMSQIINKNDPFMNAGLSPLITHSSGVSLNATSSLVTSPFGVGYTSGSISSGSCNSSTDSSAASSHNDIVLNSIFQHEQHLASSGKFLLNDSGNSSSSSTSSSFHHNFRHNPIHELSSFYYAQNQSNNIDATLD